jgi:hypothetical protein
MINDTEKNRPAGQLGNPKSKRFYSNAIRSQQARILKHFEECPRLSTIEAREQYGILHPSGRVMELRKKGHRIDTHWISAPDTNGVPHRVGLYIYQGANGGDHAI